MFMPIAFSPATMTQQNFAVISTGPGLSDSAELFSGSLALQAEEENMSPALDKFSDGQSPWLDGAKTDSPTFSASPPDTPPCSSFPSRHAEPLLARIPLSK